jgi:hypothetical protein
MYMLLPEEKAVLSEEQAENPTEFYLGEGRAYTHTWPSTKRHISETLVFFACHPPFWAKGQRFLPKSWMGMCQIVTEQNPLPWGERIPQKVCGFHYSAVSCMDRGVQAEHFTDKSIQQGEF